MSDYQVREYKPKDYDRVIELANVLFHPIVAPFSKVSFEKGAQFMKDFGMLHENKNDGLFVVEINREIAGIINLEAREIKGEGVSVSLSKVFKKYGFLKVISTIILFMLLNTKVPKNEMYVGFLVVDEKYRGKGIGSTLLNFGLNKAMEMKKEKLSLDVLGDNPKAKALYERQGFSTVKIDKFPRFLRKRLNIDVSYKMSIDL